jgi:DNA polymerase elongation subunit (family B)
LACRRSDTPEFIKAVQQELLALLTQAHTLAARQQMQPQLDALAQRYLTQLERGEIGAKQLAVQQVLSREPEEYAVSTRAALAAEQYRAAGVPVHPGERLSYVLKDTKAKDKTERVAVAASETPLAYDVAEYIRLLEAAAAEVSFEGVGL